ncbi:MAG: hypothetical protein SOU03_07000 [Dorea sp.]|nr:hypothetical protein [Dorea sp.]
MGWKIRRIIALFAILGIIFVQQSKYIELVYAKENWNPFEPQQEEEGKTESEKGEEGEKEEEGEKGENGETIEEEIECFQITIPEEDGKNGYYITKPEVKLWHVGNPGVTKYQFTDGEGNTSEGELRKEEEGVIFSEEFTEGKNHLSVWMEEEEGEKIEEFSLEKDFFVDTQKPSLKLQVPNGFDAWYQKSVLLSAVAEDGVDGSQINEVSCSYGDQEIARSRNENVSFQIQQASVKGEGVVILVRATDRAGNLTEKSCRIFIDQNPPKASLEGVQDYMITSQAVNVTYKVEEENGIGNLNAQTTWEDTEGNVKNLPVNEWKDTEQGRSAVQTLKEDGTYRLNMEVKDLAGFSSQVTSQIMIDSTNPVIRYVDQVNGKYLQSFCWDYPMEEWIQDYTSCTYIVQLDGKLYHMGENITKEGRHILSVQAVDSAGNVGEARAEFIIDHTPPKIQFGNVEEGQQYEKERIFQVEVENSEDWIEEMKINGEVQRIDSKQNKVTYTVKEEQSYEIEILALDQAGNQAVARRNFKIIPEKTILQKLTAPIEKRFMQHVDSKEEEKTETQNPEYGKMAAGVLAAGMAVVMALGGIWYRKRPHEREDAG